MTCVGLVEMIYNFIENDLNSQRTMVNEGLISYDIETYFKNDGL